MMAPLSSYILHRRAVLALALLVSWAPAAYSYSFKRQHFPAVPALRAMRVVPATTARSSALGVLSRRQFVTVAPFFALGSMAPRARAGDEGALEGVTETSLYRFMYPKEFVQTGKLLKTHLEEMNVGNPYIRGYSAGIAVDPIKLESLEKFGSAQFVGERVVGVERAKDGVLGAELLSASAFSVNGEAYYDIEYSSDSTHGNNHYMSRIAIRDGKLFVFTVQCKSPDFLRVCGQMRVISESFRLC